MLPGGLNTQQSIPEMKEFGLIEAHVTMHVYDLSECLFKHEVGSLGAD